MKIEQNPRFKNSVLCIKFVENPFWRKGFLRFLQLLLFSPNLHNHEQYCLAFLTKNSAHTIFKIDEIEDPDIKINNIFRIIFLQYLKSH